MDGFLNLPSRADEASSLRADSTPTPESMLALKLEDELPAENGSSEVSNRMSDIQLQAVQTYDSTNQRLVLEGDSQQVSDSQFVVPQPLSSPHATASRNVVISNLDDDPPVPIFIPDDSGFKRPACRHVRKKKRPNNAHDHSMGSYHACDDCETDFENEQLQQQQQQQQQQQIRPLVILSSMSLQSHHSSTPQMSRLSNVQPIEPTMHFQCPIPQSMIFDIQPTGAAVEDQLVAESSNSQVEDDTSQIYQYVATINVPSHETPSVPQELEEPRKEKPIELEKISRSGNKTFSVNEVAMMVRAELDSSRAGSTEDNNATNTQGRRSSTGELPTEKQSLDKSSAVDQTTHQERKQKDTVETEQRRLLEKPQTDKSPGKGPMVKLLVKQPHPEKPETLPAEKSRLSVQQTDKAISEETPAVNSSPEVPRTEKTTEIQTLEQQQGTKQQEDKVKDRPLSTAKPLSTQLLMEQTKPPEKSQAETLRVETVQSQLAKTHQKVHPEKLHPAKLPAEKPHPDKSVLEKANNNSSTMGKSQPGKSTLVEPSSEKPRVQHIYPTRNPHIDHSILNTAHEKAKPRNAIPAQNIDNEPFTGKEANKVKKTAPTTAATITAKLVDNPTTEENKIAEISPRMTRARNTRVAKAKQPTIPERRQLPREDIKSTENTTEGKGKQGVNTRKENNERAQRTISNTVKEKGSAKRKAKTVIRSPTTLDPEPVSKDTAKKNMASKSEPKMTQKSRQTTARKTTENVNVQQDDGSNVGTKGRITRQKAGLQNKEANSLTSSGVKANVFEGNPSSASSEDLKKASSDNKANVDVTSKFRNERETGNQITKATIGKSVANMNTTEIESEWQELTQINKASNVYDYDENDSEKNDDMENYQRERRTKRKRKMEKCIVHLDQLSSETLSTVLSTGSVTLTDDSSIASSEISKTTDTRLGDDEHDDENVTEVKGSYGEKKIKKKRMRKRKERQHFTETNKQNGDKKQNNDTPLTTQPEKRVAVDTNPKNGLKGSQGFKEIYFPYSKSNLKGKLTPYIAGSKEINNNSIAKPIRRALPGTAISCPITTTSYSVTSSLLSSRARTQIQSERLSRADIWNWEHQLKSREMPGIVSQLGSTDIPKGLSQPLSQSQHKYSDEQQQLHGPQIKKGEPWRQTEQRTEQQSSRHLENSKNVQQMPGSSGSQRQPAAFKGRPGNPNKKVGLDRKKLIDVLNDAIPYNPGDPPQQPLQQQWQQQQQQQQQQSNSTTSGSESDVNPHRYDRGLSPENIMFSDRTQKNLHPELSRGRAEAAVNSTQPAGSSQTALQRNSLPSESYAATTLPPRRIQSSAIQTALSTPPSPIPDGKPKTTFTVSGLVKAPELIMSQTSPGESMNISQTGALTPTASIYQPAPKASVAMGIASGRIEERPLSQSKLNTSGNGEKLMLETTQVAAAVRPSAATPSVRATRQPELLKARPYGQIQPTRPSIPARPVGITETPRFPTPISQQQRLLTPSDIPPTSQLKIPQASHSQAIIGPHPETSTRLSLPTQQGKPTGTFQAVRTQKQTGAVEHTNAISSGHCVGASGVVSPRMTKATGQRLIVPTHQVQPGLAIPRGTSYRPDGPTQQVLPVGPRQQSGTVRSVQQQFRLTRSLSSGAQPRVPGATPVRYLGPTQFQNSARPLQIHETAAGPLEPRIIGSVASVSSGAKPRVPGATSVQSLGPAQTQTSRPLQIQGLQTRSCEPRMTGSVSSISSGTETRVAGTSLMQHLRPTQLQVSTRPYQMQPSQARPGGFPQQIRLPADTQTIRTNQVSQQQRSTVGIQSPTQAAPTLARLVGPGLSQPASISGLSSTITAGTQNRLTYPTTILTNPMPDGRAPPPTIVRLPGLPPNARQVGPVHIAAVPIQGPRQTTVGPTESSLQEILEALRPLVQSSNLEQTLASLPPDQRASFIKIIQQDERIRDQVIVSQNANRQIQALQQSPDVMNTLLAGGFQSTVSTRPDPVRPPAYQTVTQSRPEGTPAVIAALPIRRHGQPIARTQNPPSHQSDPEFSTADRRIERIHDNVSEISAMSDHAETENIKRAAGLEALEGKAPLPKARSTDTFKPTRSKKTPKFKCRECNKTFNYGHIIEDHIRDHHQTMDVDSCIIRTAASSTKGSSVCSEPDAAVSVSESSDNGNVGEEGSQKPPTASARRPGNPNRLIGLDRKNLIGVLNDAMPFGPDDQPQQPLQQQQQHQQQQQQESNFYQENSNNNVQQEFTNVMQLDVVDLTKPDTARKHPMKSTPAETIAGPRDPATKRIRNIVKHMKANEVSLDKLAHDIKINLGGNSPASTTVPSLTTKGNDSTTPGTSVSGSSPDKNVHGGLNRAAVGGQLERNFHSASTWHTIGGSAMVTKPEVSPRFDLDRAALSNAQPRQENVLPTANTDKAQVKSATINTDGSKIPPLRSQSRKISLQRHNLLGPMLQGPMDVQLPRPTDIPKGLSQPLSQSQHKYSDEQQQLHGPQIEKGEPGRQIEQRTEQQSSRHLEISENVRQMPGSSGSHKQPTASARRPGNQHRLIGSDRKNRIGVLNDAMPFGPDDQPQQPLQQQQLQQQQQQQDSNSYQENSNNNVQQTPSANSSNPYQENYRTSLHKQVTALTGRPGKTQGPIELDKKKLSDAPVEPQAKGFNVPSQSTSNKEPHDRNGEIEIARATKPGERSRVQRRPVSMDRHMLLAAAFGDSPRGPVIGPRGRDIVMRCEVDMSRYQQRLNELITITQPNKHGWQVMEFQKKFAEYLQASENEYKEITKILKNKKILGKKFSSIDDFKQIVKDDLEAINIEIKPPSISKEQIEKQEAAFRKATFQGVLDQNADGLEAISEKTTVSLTSDKVEKQILEENTMQVSEKNNATLMQEPIRKQTLEAVIMDDASYLPEKRLQQIRGKQIENKDIEGRSKEVREQDTVFGTEEQLKELRKTTPQRLEKHVEGETDDISPTLLDTISTKMNPSLPIERIEKQTFEVAREQGAVHCTEEQLAEIGKRNLQVAKLHIGGEESLIEKQTLKMAREQDAAFNTEKQLAEISKRNPQVAKMRVGGEEAKKLEFQKPLPLQLHSQKSPLEAQSRIQERSSLTSPLVTTSRPPSETDPKISPNGEFHIPSGGQCTLVHPPGESCPVNVREKLQELKINGKPRETRYQCDLCGESLENLWKSLIHKEEIHGIEMPKTSKGIATSGTEDKTNGIEEQTSDNNVLKSQVAGRDNIESANTASNRTSENPEPGDDCLEQKTEIDSGASSSVTDHSKIPVYVIALLDDDQAAPSENVNKERRSPVREKDEIRGPLFGAAVSSMTSSAAVHPSGPSSSAVTVVPTGAAPVSLTPFLTLPPSIDISSKSPLDMLTSFAESQTSHSQVMGTGTQSALSSTVRSAGQVGNQSIYPTVISITPPVMQLEQNLQTVAKAAIRNITAILPPFITQGTTVNTSTQHDAPIQSTIPIKQLQPENLSFGQSVFPSAACVSSPITQNNAEADPDVQCIGSVVTRPTGLKLLVPEVQPRDVQPRDKPKTVRDLLGLPNSQKVEVNDPAAAVGSVFDFSVDKMVTGVRRRGRPPGTTSTKTTPGSALCKTCGKEKTNVRGQPHKCLVHSCIWCEKSFDTAQQLMDHVKNTHPQKSVYECRVCGKGFNVKGTLERHMFVHSKKKEYKCNICKLSFTQSNNLKRHIAIHTGQKAFKCGECDKAFTSKYNLSQHLLVHFPKRITYTCRFCRKSFLFARTRDKHEFTHFGFTELQCSKCLKKFPSLPSLEAHIDIYHEGIGEGEACYYDIPQVSENTKLKKSDDTTKSSDPPTAVASSSVDESGEASESVGSKGKGTPSPDKIKTRSSMTSNKKQRKHICPICNQNFFFLLHLQDHMQSHKAPGSDLYACTRCDARFRSSVALRAHIHTHSPLHCSECDEMFTFDSRLAAHKLTQHSSGNGAQEKE